VPHESSSEVNIAAMLRVKLHILQRVVVQDIFKFKCGQAEEVADTVGNLNEYGQYCSSHISIF
jgi:hypothetical protein